MAFNWISDQRKEVVRKGLEVVDKSLCGKCKHPRISKGHLNLHDEYCCEKLS